MSAGVPSIERCEAVAAILKSLAHPQRLRLLCLLVERPRNVGELTTLTGISQSAVSQFLGRMKLEGTVLGRRDGQAVVYQIASPEVSRLLAALHAIYCQGEGDFGGI